MVEKEIRDVKAAGFPENKWIDPGADVTEVLEEDLLALQEWKQETIQIEQTNPQVKFAIEAAKKIAKES